MPLLKELLPAVMLAMAVAAVLSGAAVFCRGRTQHVVASLALALGYAAGHVLITGVIKVPPADTTNWLPSFALVVAIIAALVSLVGRPIASLGAIGLVAVGALRLLLAPLFRHRWSTGEGWLWVIGLAFDVLVVAIILHTHRRFTFRPIELPLSLLIISGATAGALTLSGSLLLGQFAAVLAAAVVGSSIPTWRGTAAGDGILAVASLLLVALLASGYFFAQLPATAALLLAVAPGLAFVPLRMSPLYQRLALQLAVVSTAAAVAIIIAFRSSPPLYY